MAKRAKKPAKKREQPWPAAARAKLRAPTSLEVANVDTPEAAVVKALLDLAHPDIDALPGDATDDDLHQVVSLALVAYNLPFLDALPHEPGASQSPGEQTRAGLEDRYPAEPALRARFERMSARRRSHHARLLRPILALKSSWDSNRHVRVELSVAGEDARVVFAPRDGEG
jgi:hypothetical protein